MNAQCTSAICRGWLRRSIAFLLCLITITVFLIPGVSAASYRYTMNGGDTYTIEIGDTLHLTSPLSTADLPLFSRGWDNSNPGVASLDYTANSSFSTVTGLAPGTTAITALVDGSREVTKVGTRYNHATKRHESYTYIVYEQVPTRTCTILVEVLDTLAPTVRKQPANASAPIGGTAATTFLVDDHSAVSYQWYVKDPGSNSWELSSCTKSTYTCTMTQEISGRQVRCVATDINGSYVISQTATLGLLGISSQPKHSTVAPGKTASTTVKAYGDGLTYQWYFKAPDAGQYSKSSVTSGTYSIKMTTAKSGRSVYCVITDKYGNSVQSNTVLLKQEFYAAITKQPANDIAASGKVVSTSVKATGDGLKYQWYVKNPGSSKFTKSSVTSSTYSYTMTTDKSGRQVYCLVTDKYGNSVKSKTVTLSLLAITRQPSNVDGASTVSTSVKASGSGLKYQWYVKNPGETKFSKSSVTAATYSCKVNSKTSGRQVYCVITDKYGNSVKSNTVTLRTTVSLKIAKQPTNVTVASGQTATTNVSVSGKDKLSYQWYVKNPGETKFSKSSVTRATYAVTMTEKNSGRQIYCVIKDTYGNSVTTKTVTLKTAKPLVITAQPTASMVAPGKKVSVSVTATGTGTLHYQWYTKNAGESSFSKSSIASSTYSVTMNESRMNREIYCIVTDNYGQKVQSDTVTLTMAKPLVLAYQPPDRYARSGQQLITGISATGTGTLHYQWYEAMPGGSFQKSIYTGASYFATIDESNNGMQVYCVVWDDYGQSVTTDIATLRIAQPPVVVKQPVGQSVRVGDTFTLSVEATGTGELTYQWFSIAPGSSTPSRLAGKTSSTYTNIMSSHMAGTNYYCLITDSYLQSVLSDKATIYTK